ncbi:hypothetical protein ERICI_04190 [Paenibacillus larvae subsp. larvae]|uniref:Uncharacterized protein n=1 Tax=Paenibacillus larvae subsp. larvae TaxID=147375 RepID=A0A6C0QLG6_9BACL|nr:hypothetical protein ERICI_04190 [Paenibacillus larvae subsp. larvae]AVG10826.1 hypothetical protein ERICII_00374 [Paenibacillus larvae subsp. larvae DSM 25430]ETK29419.1 hypothetical protein ERIC1_1c29700 [Paenibacillus larvae subsp. larvae DSM 25719]QHZ49595.1 hypothetical protein ERICV_00392 [Paenibacillus larvae subsp. larvae]
MLVLPIVYRKKAKTKRLSSIDGRIILEFEPVFSTVARL